MKYLKPLDLLRLARTSRDFRNFLMIRSASPLWKTARGNVEGLPDCPPHLSEPAYTNLVFDKHCHVSHQIDLVHIYGNLLMDIDSAVMFETGYQQCYMGSLCQILSKL